MNHKVTVTQVAARPMAAIQRAVRPGQRISDWRSASAKVWAFLRKRRLSGGYNTALYTPGPDGQMQAYLGVLTDAAFEGDGDVVCVRTPEGEAALVTHHGSYDGIGDVHAAVAEWLRASGREMGGAVWEVYGEWHKDPSRREAWVYYLLRPAGSN